MLQVQLLEAAAHEHVEAGEAGAEVQLRETHDRERAERRRDGLSVGAGVGGERALQESKKTVVTESYLQSTLTL